MEGQYSGVDILEALESAHNYNDDLIRVIRESTESRDLIDFGAASTACENPRSRWMESEIRGQKAGVVQKESIVTKE